MNRLSPPRLSPNARAYALLALVMLCWAGNSIVGRAVRDDVTPFTLAFARWLIAAFVAGIALGATEHDIPERFHDFAENVSSIFQVLTFFVFGALIVATGYDGSIPALIAFVVLALVVARPVAMLISLIGTDFQRPERFFMAWFGPKGVASMLFALLVLKSAVDDGPEIFKIAAFVILASAPVLTLSARLVPVLLGAIGYGLCVSGAPTAIGAHVADHLSGRSFGAAFGSLTFVFGLGQLAGPQVAGFVADRTDSFVFPFLASSLLALVGAWCSWRLRRAEATRLAGEVVDAPG
jgi:MFS family permease